MFQRLAFGLAVLLGFGSSLLPAVAKQVPLKEAGSAFAVTLPDDWKVGPTDGGIEVKSADGEIIFWLQALAPEKVEPAIESYFAYFKTQGVAPTGAVEKHPSEVNGISVVDMNVPATWQGKPTIVRFAVIGVKPGRDKILLLGYWASPEADRAADPAMDQVLADLVSH